MMRTCAARCAVHARSRAASFASRACDPLARSPHAHRISASRAFGPACLRVGEARCGKAHMDVRVEALTMKAIAKALVLSACVLALTACGGDDGDDSNAGSGGDSGEGGAGGAGGT